MGKYRGRCIELADSDEWIYSDTKVPVKDSSRTCALCDQHSTSEGHDACLGTLIGVMNACCGHGDIDEAYIQFLDGFCVRGEDAKAVLAILKKWSLPSQKKLRVIGFSYTNRPTYRQILFEPARLIWYNIFTSLTVNGTHETAGWYEKSFSGDYRQTKGTPIFWGLLVLIVIFLCRLQ